MLLPRYHELQLGSVRSELAAVLATCSPHACCDSGVASIVRWEWSRMYVMQSDTHSTCCSADTMTFDNADGLPGPVIVNMFGKPATMSPRYVVGPSLHASRSVRPSRPEMSTRRIEPVIASKPVANTM